VTHGCGGGGGGRVRQSSQRAASAQAESAAPRHEIETARPALGLRATHPKSHGCVHGVFRVSRRLPPRHRVGMFETEGREYKAWVRFSNANREPRDDSVLDVRGAAIKLTGVDGRRVQCCVVASVC
jgi:hypothetical protein